ncbi:hypothetical protein B0A48_00871 [Cryoendolithus antarcticus]|uniref:t-SNARE affecting a late Golgi compartment protein 1 n=1 Tax=Cryoendolithus antarcticus TaxID=1507870 RepID=A0A1V8TRK9_9PEZI|nr:hypothetical protein B0A48_00871 [Cryoendolithus antarcticus]
MASSDPFLQVQSDVLALLTTTRPLFTSYLRIRSSASSASNPELLEARAELEENLTDLSTDLQDLLASVAAVETDPYRYGLDVAEVGRRRKLVEDVGKEIESMHQQLNSAAAKVPLPHPDQFDVQGGEGEEGEDEYGAWEEQRQVEIMHEQDEVLEGVFQTVGNLRLQADTMGRELEEQAEMLDEVEDITDRVGGKIQTGMKKIGYVIRKNEASHPLLQQVPLTVNPFLDLPKPPTLPHNYASLPSTLPPSILHSAPAPSAPEHPAYITSASGSFAAHPSTIVAQNKALLAQLSSQRSEAEKRIREWEEGIKERELAEKRRKAPGYLDSDVRVLEPEKVVEKGTAVKGSLMDEPEAKVDVDEKKKVEDELGSAMDRAFGRSEMG